MKLHRTGPGIRSLVKETKRSPSVDVGIIDAGQHDDSNLTVAEIGIVHEWGATVDRDDAEPIIIPERSFIRSTLSEQENKIKQLKKKLLQNALKGLMPVKQALGILGSKVASEITQKIVDLDEPANKASTIAAKGSENPLINNKHLANSITWRVNYG